MSNKVSLKDKIRLLRILEDYVDPKTRIEIENALNTFDESKLHSKVFIEKNSESKLIEDIYKNIGSKHIHEKEFDDTIRRILNNPEIIVSNEEPENDIIAGPGAAGPAGPAPGAALPPPPPPGRLPPPLPDRPPPGLAPLTEEAKLEMAFDQCVTENKWDTDAYNPEVKIDKALIQTTITNLKKTDASNEVKELLKLTMDPLRQNLIEIFNDTKILGDDDKTKVTTINSQIIKLQKVIEDSDNFKDLESFQKLLLNFEKLMYLIKYDVRNTKEIIDSTEAVFGFKLDEKVFKYKMLYLKEEVESKSVAVDSIDLTTIKTAVNKLQNKKDIADELKGKILELKKEDSIVDKIKAEYFKDRSKWKDELDNILTPIFGSFKISLKFNNVITLDTICNIHKCYIYMNYAMEASSHFGLFLHNTTVKKDAEEFFMEKNKARFNGEDNNTYGYKTDYDSFKSDDSTKVAAVEYILNNDLLFSNDITTITTNTKKKFVNIIEKTDIIAEKLKLFDDLAKEIENIVKKCINVSKLLINDHSLTDEKKVDYDAKTKELNFPCLFTNAKSLSKPFANDQIVKLQKFVMNRKGGKVSDKPAAPAPAPAPAPAGSDIGAALAAKLKFDHAAVMPANKSMDSPTEIITILNNWFEIPLYLYIKNDISMKVMGQQNLKISKIAKELVGVPNIGFTSATSDTKFSLFEEKETFEFDLRKKDKFDSIKQEIINQISQLEKNKHIDGIPFFILFARYIQNMNYDRYRSFYEVAQLTDNIIDSISGNIRFAYARKQMNANIQSWYDDEKKANDNLSAIGQGTLQKIKNCLLAVVNDSTKVENYINSKLLVRLTNIIANLTKHLPLNKENYYDPVKKAITNEISTNVYKIQDITSLQSMKPIKQNLNSGGNIQDPVIIEYSKNNYDFVKEINKYRVAFQRFDDDNSVSLKDNAKTLIDFLTNLYKATFNQFKDTFEKIDKDNGIKVLKALLHKYIQADQLEKLSNHKIVNVITTINFSFRGGEQFVHRVFSAFEVVLTVLLIIIIILLLYVLFVLYKQKDAEKVDTVIRKQPNLEFNYNYPFLEDSHMPI